MRSFGRGLARLALVGVAACSFDSEGQSGSGSATIASTIDPSDTSSAASSDSGEGPSGGGTVDPDTGCPPGNIGCPCDENDACHDVLSCVDDVCLSPSCGNGMKEAFEDCDDDNEIDDDGCDANCMVSQGVARLALGLDSTCVVFHSGAVRCWGNPERGKTGHGDLMQYGLTVPTNAAPTLVLGGASSKVGLGVQSSCALKVDGSIVCWGAVTIGMLGYGPAIVEDIGDTEPANTGGAVDIGGNAIDIAVGAEHVCAVRIDGRVLCWGNGATGRLGYGSVASVGITETPATIGPVDLGGMAATHVAAGLAHSCALLENQEVHCWGSVEHGILGDPTLVQNLGDDVGETPAMGVKVDLGGPAIAIDAGNQHTCALLANSTVRCWGFGSGGRLGLGTGDDIGDNETPALLPVDLGGPAVQIAVGRAHTCALRQDGALLCWGTGDAGKLGSDATMDLGDQPEEVPAMLLPVLVVNEPGVAVLSVDGGGDHTCARLSGGRVRCWGRANQGQLGYGDAMDVGSGQRTILQAMDVPVGPA